MEKIEIGEVFTISDENNEEHEVEVLANMTLEETEYVAVSFVEDLKEENDADIDVFFLKVDEDSTFSAIDSDEEFDKVSVAFEQFMDEEEDESESN
ncbi:DUF1292 domain-containing protein [Anaerobacillus arseniciselenatis]|uniref:DUF1292 domain-containing protein n=1 Tax=Anaerobacillus arseniciselenatis TaxID=85682 RepID=A0A1S2LSC4_9BACI|nr:DUF1292 domain-containing protein [Anaerobacillus arseniciselenatis]OIJ15234.1 DUF1292 domain-containing protein [Anaerobacillus arseniciselenatis]